MARPNKDEQVYLFEVDAEGKELGVNKMPFSEALEALSANEQLPDADRKHYTVARKFDISFERVVKVRPKY